MTAPTAPPTKWTLDFESACREWQLRLGLTDWTLSFRVAPADGKHEATVEYDCDDRHAEFVAHTNVESPLSPDRVALHEMLHLLFADFARDGKDAEREEHRAIERILNAFIGRP